MRADGRYAPSPSADLHLGNLRTALLAWLAAHAEGGVMRLRIDDLDEQRSRPEIEERQRSDLLALGLRHDGPVERQSARQGRYATAFEELVRLDAVFPCFCTRREISEAQQAPHGDPEAYPGTCRHLTEAERAEREAAGRRPAWRLRAPEPGTDPSVDDLVLGPLPDAVHEAVLRRADGAFGYQLAVVLDDADQDVGTVVRGADLAGSCATQRHLQRLLGLPAVCYAHVPLMLGPDGVRLAKRHGSATLGDARAGTLDLALPGLAKGAPATPDELRTALAATVGLARPGEAAGLDELVARFDYDALPAASTMMHGWP